MEFKKFNDKIQEQFALMCATGQLFRVKIGGDQLWEMYLRSFENAQTFRDPSTNEHDCKLCNNFIRRYANVVAIDSNGFVMSMFDTVSADMEEYFAPAKVLGSAIRESAIVDVFLETYIELKQVVNYEKVNKTLETFKLGIHHNVKQYTIAEANAFPRTVNVGEIYTFHHFQVDLPRAFVDFTGKSIQSIIAKYRDRYSVFKRSMVEIPLETYELVRDLIAQGSLYNGDSYLPIVETMIGHKKIFDVLGGAIDEWCWQTTYDMHEAVAKFKNTSMGSFCSELAEGKKLNTACAEWHRREDPANKHKPIAPITPRQIAEAEKFLQEGGYAESFDRRLMAFDDIGIEEIVHINIGDGVAKAATILKGVKAVSTRHKRNEFDGVPEVTIANFMKDILPNCTSVEAFFTNKMEGNLVTMTTAKNPNSKPIFKYTNNFSKTFKGNLAGKSMIKEAVKAAGGGVDGIINFRIAWNIDEGTDNSDLDAWCIQPGGERIGFSTQYRKDRGNTRTRLSGQLDVDRQHTGGKMAVENITFNREDMLVDGDYQFYIHQFSNRRSAGFESEVEVDGEISQYVYDKALKTDERVIVATVSRHNGEFTVQHHLPLAGERGTKSKEHWGIETNKFHKVNLMCLSPNHWGGNQVGDLTFMFMLEGCKADEPIRGFHNADLNADLLKHRKVMEVLGLQSLIEPSEKQLSGIGFNSTVKDEVVLRLKGNFNRVVKVTI